MASLQERISADDSRRQSIIEWRASVQAAIEGDPSHDDNNPGFSRDDYEQESVESDTTSSSPYSADKAPDTAPARRASWRSKLSVSPIWPWLTRTSNSCGHALLLALVQSSSLAVENGDYRDSINALGIDSVEYQWQTWNMGLGGRV